MFRILFVTLLLSSAAAFAPSAKRYVSTAVCARSGAVPFLEKPDALDGSMAGDVGEY